MTPDRRNSHFVTWQFIFLLFFFIYWIAGCSQQTTSTPTNGSAANSRDIDQWQKQWHVAKTTDARLAALVDFINGGYITNKTNLEQIRTALGSELEIFDQSEDTQLSGRVFCTPRAERVGDWYLSSWYLYVHTKHHKINGIESDWVDNYYLTNWSPFVTDLRDSSVGTPQP